MRIHSSRALSAREKHGLKCICISNFKNIFQNLGPEFDAERNVISNFEHVSELNCDNMIKKINTYIKQNVNVSGARSAQ